MSGIETQVTSILQNSIRGLFRKRMVWAIISEIVVAILVVWVPGLNSVFVMESISAQILGIEMQVGSVIPTGVRVMFEDVPMVWAIECEFGTVSMLVTQTGAASFMVMSAWAAVAEMVRVSPVVTQALTASVQSCDEPRH